MCACVPARALFLNFLLILLQSGLPRVTTQKKTPHARCLCEENFAFSEYIVACRLQASLTRSKRHMRTPRHSSQSEILPTSHHAKKAPHARCLCVVTRGRIELPFQPWEGRVLAAWPTGRIINRPIIVSHIFDFVNTFCEKNLTIFRFLPFSAFCCWFFSFMMLKYM